MCAAQPRKDGRDGRIVRVGTRVYRPLARFVILSATEWRNREIEKEKEHERDDRQKEQATEGGNGEYKRDEDADRSL